MAPFNAQPTWGGPLQLSLHTECMEPKSFLLFEHGHHPMFATLYA